MNTAIQATTVLLPLAYACATVLFGMSFAGERQPQFARRLRDPLLALCILLHTGLFGLHWVASGAPPILNTWLLVSATGLITVVYFIATASRAEQGPVGSIVLGGILALQTLVSMFGPTTSLGALQAPDSLILIHVVTSLLAVAALVLSGIYGSVHLLLYRQMRRKQFGPIFQQLPDLELLARMTRRAALIGFLVLMVGVNIGIWQAHARAVEGFDYTDPHVLSILLIWLHFGAIAFSGRIGLISARNSSIAATFGLVVLIVGLLLTLLPDWTFHTIG